MIVPEDGTFLQATPTTAKTKSNLLTHYLTNCLGDIWGGSDISSMVTILSEIHNPQKHMEGNTNLSDEFTPEGTSDASNSTLH